MRFCRKMPEGRRGGAHTSQPAASVGCNVRFRVGAVGTSKNRNGREADVRVCSGAGQPGSSLPGATCDRPAPADDDRECAVLHSHNYLVDQRADDPLTRRRQCSGLAQACSTSAPNESRRVRSVCVGAAAETANSRSNPCSSSCTSIRREFQRCSRPAATRRLSGFTASYCRCARAARRAHRAQPESRVAAGVRSPQRRRRDRCACRQRKCSEHSHD